MNIVLPDWSERHKKLNQIIRKSEYFAQSIKMILDLHKDLHTAIVSELSDQNMIDTLWEDLSHNQRYTTDSVSAAIFKAVCEKANVPFQQFFNRSDMPGGSTLGNILNSHISLNTVDIGLAQLAMHSPYETAGAKDPPYLADAMRVFYSMALKDEGMGTYSLC